MSLRTLTTTLLFSAFVACGGAVAQDLGGDGGNPSDGGGTGDGGGTDGGSDARADAMSTDAGTSCDNLQAKIDGLRPRALECCYTCNVQQCDRLVEDLCCPISVTSLNTSKVKPFEDAVQAFKNAGCQVPCPAVPCHASASMQCQKNGVCVP